MPEKRASKKRSTGSRLSEPQSVDKAVFVNIPYDEKFKDLYLAYIVGISALRLVPYATLGIPGIRRLDRIFSLITACKYSIHDLSRVEVDGHPPRTPRFNMPLELGLAVAWERTAAVPHSWFIFESELRRAEKSCSDISGTDVYIHDGEVRGVFRELRNALVRPHTQPTVPQMMTVYNELKPVVLRILRNAGTSDVYKAQVFSEIRLAAQQLVSKHIGTR
jgi:hypothetical protein